MPFINIKTNVKVSAEKAEAVKSALGRAITAVPGKSESWLMVGIEDDYTLYFKGSDEPAAMTEVSLFGNASGKTLEELTGSITSIVNENLDVPPDRVYVSYMMTENWGWNGSNL